MRWLNPESEDDEQDAPQAAGTWRWWRGIGFGGGGGSTGGGRGDR